MENTVKERLISFIKYEGLSQRAFEMSVGLSNGYVNNIRVSIQPGTLQKIALKYPYLNHGWLLTGEGEMIKGEKKVYDAMVYDIPENIIKAPLIGQYANGGYLRGFADPVYLEEQPVFYSTRKHTNGNYVAFEVRGDSMDGGRDAIREGDILLGRELKKEYWTCKFHIPKVFIIVHRTEGITVKEIVEHDVETGRIVCHCWNTDPEFEDFELNLNDVHQLFYIKEVSRNVKY